VFPTVLLNGPSHIGCRNRVGEMPLLLTIRVGSIETLGLLLVCPQVYITGGITIIARFGDIAAQLRNASATHSE